MIPSINCYDKTFKIDNQNWNSGGLKFEARKTKPQNSEIEAWIHLESLGTQKSDGRKKFDRVAGKLHI